MQQGPEEGSAAPETVQVGARLLYLAIELDRRMYQGLPFAAALQQLKSGREQFDPAMLETLADYLPASGECHRESFTLAQLFPGMTLEEDVLSETTGMKIFQAETILTDTWIERLRNFAKTQGIKPQLRVRVPGPARAPVFRMAARPVWTQTGEAP